MKLRYHKGQNFGDALNPYIWDFFLPNFFDDDESILFVGFGTILGFNFDESSRKVVFSSGIAVDQFDNYGNIPSLDKTWDIRCVRGPLTADILEIDQRKALIDGAVLIREMVTQKPNKEYKISYMPHVASLDFFDLQKLCDSIGIHFINPKKDCEVIIQDILKSEVIVCEAMHGAIVADALNVQWVPFKMYRHINEFKWNDWAESLEMKRIEFHESNELYNNKWLKNISLNKVPKQLSFLSTPISWMYAIYQRVFVLPSVKKAMLNAAEKGRLSDRKILESKIRGLKIEIDKLKEDYAK